MINNYRSRSFSYESFKQAKPGTSLPHSVIFTPANKKASCGSPNSNYPITYISPHQYYSNYTKNCEMTPLEGHLPLNHSTSIRYKRFPRAIFDKHHEKQSPSQEKKAEGEVLVIREQRQQCLYNYFASLAKQGQEQDRGQGEGEGGGRGKSKSIMVIRKINKRKEELAERTRERLQAEFRGRKQVPIHHTQFHFHKQRKSRTQQSPSHQQQKADFTQKIHRAVEEILRLRATLGKPQEPQNAISNDIEEREFRGIIIEGGNFSAPPPKAFIPFLTKPAKPARKAKAKACSVESGEEEIGPWVRTTNDFQFLQ